MYAITHIQHLVPNQADGTDISTDDLYSKSIFLEYQNAIFFHIKDIKIQTSRVLGTNLHPSLLRAYN